MLSERNTQDRRSVRCDLTHNNNEFDLDKQDLTPEFRYLSAQSESKLSVSAANEAVQLLASTYACGNY